MAQLSSPSAEGDGRSTRAAAQRERRRSEVLERSLRVFSDKGYHATRVSDLVEAAGIARGTFYLYFESKNAIFHELLDDLLEQVRDSMGGVDTGQDAPPLRAQLRAIVRRVLATFRDHPAVTRLVLRSAPGLDPDVDRKLAAFHGRLHAWLADSIDNAQRLGLVRHLDAEAVAWSVLGAVKQHVENALDSGASDDGLDRSTDALLSLHLDGLLAR